MSGPTGTTLYRRAVQAAVLLGVYVLHVSDTPLAIGPDACGPIRVPFWLRREQALEFARAARPSSGAKPHLVRTRALLDDLLPELESSCTPLWLNGPEPELVEPARFAQDLSLYVKPRRPSSKTPLVSPPGVGFQMFEAFVSRLAPALKARGFTRSGLCWFLRGTGVWGDIGFQKDQHNHGDTCGFTVNVSVSSDRLRFFHGVSNFKARPRASDACGEGHRLGFLLPQRRDIWWTFSLDSNAEATEREVEAAILGPGVAFLRQLRSDEALRDRWLANGLYSARAIDLAVLLHDLGPREPLPALIESIRADARARRWNYAEALVRRIFEQDRSAFGKSADVL
jgi:hypothetical protein